MPRDTLTREQIIEAAIGLLDEEGLEGLNMRSLGKRLGSAATAVYWHVQSKDNLVVLASDEVWTEIELPDLDTVDWHTAASTMAGDLFAMFTRHPWLVMAFASQPLYGPNKARHDDHSLAVYEKAGFVGAEVDQATAAVFMYVLGNAVGMAAEVSVNRKLSRHGGNSQTRIEEAMTHATEIAARFPRLRSRTEAFADSDYAAAPEKSFEFGLQAVLSGLTDRLGSR
ncbi:TetR/AcrR family transcriptional regulator [Streptomyces sp. ALB3]|uniref:TetR/AcrR family transcriptional regulator n=1 Tax=Streptomyces sp. ALB3 TaxID=3374278 RepID=UPI00378CFAC8